MAPPTDCSVLTLESLPEAELEMPHRICYSEKYFDEVYEYRHVILPKDVASNVPPGRLMSEAEWRKLGVQQSRGWVHYMVHKPEPHILFRRPKQT